MVIIVIISDILCLTIHLCLSEEDSIPFLVNVSKIMLISIFYECDFNEKVKVYTEDWRTQTPRHHFEVLVYLMVKYSVLTTDGDIDMQVQQIVQVTV